MARTATAAWEMNDIINAETVKFNFPILKREVLRCLFHLNPLRLLQTWKGIQKLSQVSEIVFLWTTMKIPIIVEFWSEIETKSLTVSKLTPPECWSVAKTEDLWLASAIGFGLNRLRQLNLIMVELKKNSWDVFKWIKSKIVTLHGYISDLYPHGENQPPPTRIV